LPSTEAIDSGSETAVFDVRDVADIHHVAVLVA